MIKVKVGARKLGVESVTVGAGLRLTFGEGRALERPDVERMIQGSHLPLQFSIGEKTVVDAELPGRSDGERLAQARSAIEGMCA